jgi:nucleoside-diphosphate-sugar epimerase
VSVVITGVSGLIGQELFTRLKIDGLVVKGVSLTKSSEDIKLVRSYREAPDAELLIHLGENSSINAVETQGREYYQKQIEIIDSLSKRYDKVIYASSGVLYGDKLDGPATEDYPVSGGSYYKDTKLYAEQSLIKNNNAVIMRLSNIYGVNIKPSTIIHDVFNQLGSGEILIKNERAARDYLQVSDLIDLISLVTKKYRSGIYNVGLGEATSSRQLAELFVTVFKTGDVVTSKYAEDSYLVLDNSLVKKEFSWTPKVSLKKGIELIREGQCGKNV